MGCDIHVFVEYRVDNGKWQAHQDHILQIIDKGTEDEFKNVIEVSATCRNYALFTALAGVRGGDICNKPRGIPDDLSEIVKIAIDEWSFDAHSHSYLSLDEFEEILIKMEFPQTDRTDMFYNWREHSDRPPYYSTIVTACRVQAMELSKIDEILLDDVDGSTVEHRIVFFFDN